jgi:RNA polymerase sigma-70 factor (ECF subfamily)
LLLIAGEELDSDLQAKAGASDLVQDTLLEAQRGFADFKGDTHRQLLAWLRRILLNNLANFNRRYRRTQRRQVAREVSLDADPRLSGLLKSDSSTPSGKTIRREEVEALEQALLKLPEHYRQVIVMRHRENRSFAEIGKQLERSADAARMLWWRALENLAEQLSDGP